MSAPLRADVAQSIYAFLTERLSHVFPAIALDEINRMDR